MLHSVNGRTLPTLLPTPIPEAPTILSGSITLHEDGNATLVERRRGWGIPSDRTSTEVVRYNLNGDEIGIEPKCSDTGICALIRGVLIDGVLSIDFDPTPQHDLIYEYHLATE
ncbi:MAG TPA: hypothetical protein VNO75_06205 [Gemmatimonadaceae bacterium]|nr:hypothetical protein [Gemmatimonadaceae bacterium]